MFRCNHGSRRIVALFHHLRGFGQQKGSPGRRSGLRQLGVSFAHRLGCRRGQCAPGALPLTAIIRVRRKLIHAYRALGLLSGTQARDQQRAAARSSKQERHGEDAREHRDQAALMGIDRGYAKRQPAPGCDKVRHALQDLAAPHRPVVQGRPKQRPARDGECGDPYQDQRWHRKKAGQIGGQGKYPEVSRVRRPEPGRGSEHQCRSSACAFTTDWSIYQQ